MLIRPDGTHRTFHPSAWGLAVFAFLAGSALSGARSAAPPPVSVSLPVPDYRRLNGAEMRKATEALMARRALAMRGLERTLGDRSLPDDARAEAAVALGVLGGHEAVPTLVEQINLVNPRLYRNRMDAPDPQVCRWALGFCGRDAVRVLLRMLAYGPGPEPSDETLDGYAAVLRAIEGSEHFAELKVQDVKTHTQYPEARARCDRMLAILRKTPDPAPQ